MLDISRVILVRTDSNLCRRELTVHWSAPNSLIRSYLQPCTNSMGGGWKWSCGSQYLIIPDCVCPTKGGSFLPISSHHFPETWSYILSIHIPFVPCQSALPLLRYSIFKIWSWKSRVKVKMTMMLHNYRSRKFHRTSNGINPSSGFTDMGSLKFGPSAPWFDKFWANGQAHMAQMGKWPWQCTTTGLDNSTELSSPEAWGVKMVWIKKYMYWQQQSDVQIDQGAFHYN